MSPPSMFDSLASTRLPTIPVHLAIGIFDGVHLGHRAVIEAAHDSARLGGGIAGVLTFFPHPSRLLAPDRATKLLVPPEVKRWRLLHRMGVGFVIEEPFTAKFAAIRAEDFVAHLVGYLPNLAGVFVGENWRFGHARKGDVAMLKRLCVGKGIHVFSAPRVSFDGEPISSTRIRALVEAGQIESANALLGYPYTSIGTVVAGKRLGRTIGIPTLNLPWAPESRPPYGVYCVKVSREDGDEGLPAVANFGVRPTVNPLGDPLLEVHLLGSCGFDEGDRLRVEWCRFERQERKFLSVEDLREQIEADKIRAAGYFGMNR